MMEVNSIHGQFLCILQKVNFSLCWSHPPVGRATSISLILQYRAVKQSVRDLGQFHSSVLSLARQKEMPNPSVIKPNRWR